MSHPFSCILSLDTSFAGSQIGYGICDRIKTSSSDAFAQYYTAALQVLYYYDYLLTLPDEVLFTLYPLTNLSPLRRSSMPGRGEKRGVSPQARFVLSALTVPVFWVFILVN